MFATKLKHFAAFFVLLVFIVSAFADLKICSDDVSVNTSNPVFGDVAQFELDNASDDNAEQPFHILDSSYRGLKKSLKSGKWQVSAQFVFLLQKNISIKQKNVSEFLKNAKHTIPRFSKYLSHIKKKTTLF